MLDPSKTRVSYRCWKEIELSNFCIVFIYMFVLICSVVSKSICYYTLQFATDGLQDCCSSPKTLHQSSCTTTPTRRDAPNHHSDTGHGRTHIAYKSLLSLRPQGAKGGHLVLCPICPMPYARVFRHASPMECFDMPVSLSSFSQPVFFRGSLRWIHRTGR